MSTQRGHIEGNGLFIDDECLLVAFELGKGLRFPDKKGSEIVMRL